MDHSNPHFPAPDRQTPAKYKVWKAPPNSAEDKKPSLRLRFTSQTSSRFVSGVAAMQPLSRVPTINMESRPTAGPAASFFFLFGLTLLSSSAATI